MSALRLAIPRRLALVCLCTAGWAFSFGLIPLETYLSRDARPEHRSRTFACYAVSLTLGGAVGIGLGPNLFAPGAAGPFALAGGVVFLCGLALLGYRPRRSPNAEGEGIAP